LSQTPRTQPFETAEQIRRETLHRLAQFEANEKTITYLH
jgi:hypothetical protein